MKYYFVSHNPDPQGNRGKVPSVLQFYATAPNQGMAYQMAMAHLTQGNRKAIINAQYELTTGGWKQVALPSLLKRLFLALRNGIVVPLPSGHDA